MKKRAILYLRVSTEEQTKGYSLRSQETELTNYCLQHNWEIVRVIKEPGQSAKTFKRKSWIEFEESLKKRINSDIADIFLVTKIDRFSRNQGETRRIVDFLKSKNIRVYTANDGLYDFQNVSTYYSNVINSASAEYENLLKARNVKQAQVQGLEEGRWMWRAPIGYKNDTINKIIYPDDLKAPIVRFCFEMIAKGIYTVEEVRKMSSEKGLKLSKSSFHHLLRNPVYAGLIIRHAYETETGLVPEKTIKGIHQPLITEEVFYTVQTVLNGRSKKYKGKTKKTELFLGGFLYCPICGNKMTGSAPRGNGGNYHYYHCQRKHGCNNSFRAEKANEAFISLLKGIQPRKEILALYRAMLEKHFESNFNSIELQRKMIEKQIDEIDSKKRSFCDRFINSEGLITDQDFRSIMDRIEEQRSTLIMQHATLKSLPTEYDNYLNFGLSLLGNLQSYFENVDLDTQQRIIGSIFPEKLIFEKNKYRTTKMNGFFELYCSISKGLNEKLPSSNAKQFNLAPPSGLEPETP